MVGPKMKLKRLKTRKQAPITAMTPPHEVKSVLVKTAYRVSAITTAAVIKAAAKTIRPS